MVTLEKSPFVMDAEHRWMSKATGGSGRKRGSFNTSNHLPSPALINHNPVINSNTISHGSKPYWIREHDIISVPFLLKVCNSKPKLKGGLK